MGISVADNFSYLGAKPLDGRVKYDTIAQMAAMSASTLYDGIIAYCVADGKNYQWKSTNDVDATLGKWRELASGGGGSIPIATASTLGGIKVGSGLTITQDGTLSALSAPVALGDVINSSALIIDKSTGEVHISWSDPNDVPGETGGYLAQWKETLLVKKVGSVPASPSDGTTICTNIVKNQYSAGTGYVTDTISTDPTVNTYYRFFPVSAQDIVTYGAIKKVNVSITVYGFKITQSESDPSTRVTYLEDAVGMTPAKMDFTNNSFDYGSWSNAFFMAGLTPVMLYSDGTEAYALDPNDLTKKADGTASDVSNVNFDGNAMMRVPKVYIKAVEDNSGDINVYISDDQVDSDYHCWAHHDDQGNEIPYLYLPIYVATYNNNKMRSISGASSAAQTLANMITYANSNNPTGKNIWSPMTFSGWSLIRFLAILISKSTSTYEKFGYSVYSGNGNVAAGVYNDKGLFYGTSGNASVKIFGLENYYGMRQKRILGFCIKNAKYYYKMTYGQEDGSTQDGYTTDGTGYIDSNISAPSASASFVKNVKCLDGALLPDIVTGGSRSTYYTDKVWNNADSMATMGGYSNLSNGNGLFTCYFYSPTATDWDIGTGLECRPRLGEESIVS